MSNLVRKRGTILEQLFKEVTLSCITVYTIERDQHRLLSKKKRDLIFLILKLTNHTKKKMTFHNLGLGDKVLLKDNFK
jgi:hypothetical protein